MSITDKVVLEYIWIDSQNDIRSKIKIIKYIELYPPDNSLLNSSIENPDNLWKQITQNFNKFSSPTSSASSSSSSSSSYNLPNIAQIPIWNFDGSSTGQATGNESDIILRPVRIYNNPFFETDKIKSFFILCECYNKDYSTHITNTRYKCVETSESFKQFKCLFGIEQEYVLFERKSSPIIEQNYVMFEETIPSNIRVDCDNTNNNDIETNNCIPYKWIDIDDPGKGPQGPYYCSIGGDRAFGREIVNEHMLLCLKTGIEICGTNAEVMASQWEFQIGTCDVLKVCDDLIMARYILHRITEKHNCWASFHPKPCNGNWNGSGGHTNFSTDDMRQIGGFKHILEACEKMRSKHFEHIEVYGKDNHMRLTGAHETSGITDFNWGVGNRGCSVRIPLQVFHNGCGYLEDRRPASNCDPYLVTEIIMRTICSVPDQEQQEQREQREQQEQREQREQRERE